MLILLELTQNMLALEPYAILSNKKKLTFYHDDKMEERDGMDIGPFKYAYNREDESPKISSGWDPYRETITTVVFDNSFANYTNITSTAYWFYGFKQLSSIQGISNLNTSEATDMTMMFYECSSLTNLDLSHFDTSKVTNMEAMFYDCSALTSLNVSNFNTNAVTNMAFMFRGCSSLLTLDISSFNTTNHHGRYVYELFRNRNSRPDYF